MAVSGNVSSSAVTPVGPEPSRLRQSLNRTLPPAQSSGGSDRTRGASRAWTTWVERFCPVMSRGKKRARIIAGVVRRDWSAQGEELSKNRVEGGRPPSFVTAIAAGGSRCRREIEGTCFTELPQGIRVFADPKEGEKRWLDIPSPHPAM